MNNEPLLQGKILNWPMVLNALHTKTSIPHPSPKLPTPCRCQPSHHLIPIPALLYLFASPIVNIHIPMLLHAMYTIYVCSPCMSSITTVDLFCFRASSSSTSPCYFMPCIPYMLIHHACPPSPHCRPFLLYLFLKYI